MKTRVLPAALLCLAVVALSGAAPNSENAPIRLALKAEKLTAPAGVTLPMFETLELLPRGDGRYDIRLAPGSDAPAVREADLRLLVPRVPRLAKGSAALTRLALIQREFNRNEVHNEVPGGLDLSLANNCLEQGLWEIKLARTEADKTVTLFHAWFTFPKSEYLRLFEAINGIPYRDYEGLFASYPGVGGFTLPLDELRTVGAERALAHLETHAAEPLQRLTEQQRKTKLLLTSDVATYGDFSQPAKQPITTAKFSPPGAYDDKEPMRFDLTWLAKPSRLLWREVANPKAESAAFPEIEALFENGYRILIADSRIASLPARTDAPRTEADVLKLVCGIGTPTIQATAAERAAELAQDQPRYLMLIDAKGVHIDNHLTGVDGVYVWREAGDAGLLHLWLVGYERIAFVAHLSARWPAPETAGAARDAL
jgi:hypothetical protein